MVDLVYRNTYNMFVRPCTSDDLVCDEAQEYLRLFIDKKNYDVFLDIGANIGSVTSLAKEINPIMEIICYEPDKENFDVLHSNTKNFSSIRRYRVALGTGEKDINLFKAKGSNKGKHSIISRSCNMDKPTNVHQLDFRKELIRTNCTLLKIDIEGGEYSLDLYNLPEKIKGLAIEFHLIDNNYSQMLYLYQGIKSQFGLVLGDTPEEESLEYFKEAYSEKDSAFMCIFLRNEK